jgi:hypothetical protein
MDQRVFWGVLCALFVFSGVALVVYAVVFAYQREQLTQFEQKTQRDAVAMRSEVWRTPVVQRGSPVASLPVFRFPLQSWQRCVDGVVVVVRGSVYTDVGYVGHVAHCLGGYADQPMR